MRTPFDLIQALRSWFHAKDGAVFTGGHDINTGGGDVIVGAGSVDGVDLTAHVADGDAHHVESHTVASHSDTSGTGSELDTLTDGSNADALHDHAVGSHTIASHSDTTGTGAELNTLTDGSDASSLHDHDGRYFQESEFTSSPGANSKPLESNSSGQATLVDLLTSSSVRTGSGITVGNTTNTPGDALIMLEERATPGTPASGHVYIWAATTGRVYSKDDTGTVRELSNV